MKPIYAIGSLVVFFVFGFYVSFFSREFAFEIADNSTGSASRSPAAIKRSYDFSGYEGSALHLAMKNRLLSGAKVIYENNDVGVEFGHFVVKALDGNKEFACQRYGQIVLQFQGEGMSIAGEPSIMEVQGACEISSDVNSIAAIWIPVSRIRGEPVSDGEFDFREGRPVKVTFSNVSDQWPNLWMLKSVKLVDPSGKNSEVTIDSQELKSIEPKPFLVEFR